MELFSVTMLNQTNTQNGAIWHIRLLGNLAVESISEEHRSLDTRFRTRQTASLLAYLAYFSDKAHPREALIDIFWPDADIKSGRGRLSLALNALRTQLETDNHGGGTVILADSFAVRLNAHLIRTDVSMMQRSLTAARRETVNVPARAAHLLDALHLWTGNLLCGLYDSWIIAEQQLLTQQYRDAVRDLVALCLGGTGTTLPPHLLADAKSEVARAATLLAVYDGQDAPNIQELIASSDQIAQFHRATEVGPTAGISISRSTSEQLPEISLPLPINRFFGRDEEIVALTASLCEERNRLVTITGIGGVGKTRFAIEVARRLPRTHFTGRIAMVSLADLRDVDQLPGRLCRVLGVEATAQEDLFTLLRQSLPEHGFSLLVLDNLEHLNGEAVSNFVVQLLESTPQLQLLTTSRTTLQLSVERVFPLHPLPLPKEIIATDSSHLAGNPCLALLVDRARAVRPDFRLSTTNSEIATRLCHSLEGIPLSIELVAARLSVLSLAQAEEKVRERFTLLESNKRDLPRRHRSLRAVLDYSYDLLPTHLKERFIALSVFRGGWSAAAAKEVCDADLDDLSALCENSMIIAQEIGNTVRFSMLETLRQYAKEYRSQHARTAQITERHRGFYLRLAEEAVHHLQNRDQMSWFNYLEMEIDNLRTILDVATLTPEGATERVRIATALHRFFLIRGYAREGRRYLEQALQAYESECPQQLPQLLTNAYNAAGVLAWSLGDYEEARSYIDTSLRHISQDEGDSESRQCNEARAFNNLGIVATLQKQFVEARECYRKALSLYKQLGNDGNAGVVLTNVGAISVYLDDLDTAKEAFEEGLHFHEMQGDQFSIAMSLQNLAEVARRQKDIRSAARLLIRCLTVRQPIVDRSSDTSTLMLAASLLLSEQPSEHTVAQAAVLFGAEQIIREARGESISFSDQVQYEQDLATMRSILPEAVWRSKWQEGAMLPVNEALEFAHHQLQRLDS